MKHKNEWGWGIGGQNTLQKDQGGGSGIAPISI